MKYEEIAALSLASRLGVIHEQDKLKTLQEDIKFIMRDVRHKCAENLVNHVSRFERDVCEVINDCHNAVMNTDLDRP